MCDATTNPGQEIKDFIEEIVRKYKFGSKPEISYNTGNETGDGYLSRSFAVTISNRGKESLNLFVKTALQITAESSLIPFNTFYANEIHFYEVIYPAYLAFLEEKKIRESFRNVPKCYGTSPKNIIALENLQTKGYVIFDNIKFMSDKQIELAFKAIAKFHAISFALKDQRRLEYERLVGAVGDANPYTSNETFVKPRTGMINDFLNCLDPIKDKHVLEGVGNLADNLNDAFRNTVSISKEDTILIQGDFWSNNVMFSYDDQNQEPCDIMLIDWQMIRSSLPVHDLVFFFYTLASKPAMEKLNYFLKVYHDELSENIKTLGSDPEVLFPYSALEKQWKEQAKYGFGMAFLSIILTLKEKDENIFSFEEVDLEDPSSWCSHLKIRRYDEYIQRLKAVTEHMIANDFL